MMILKPLELNSSGNTTRSVLSLWKKAIGRGLSEDLNVVPRSCVAAAKLLLAVRDF